MRYYICCLFGGLLLGWVGWVWLVVWLLLVLCLVFVVVFGRWLGFAFCLLTDSMCFV